MDGKKRKNILENLRLKTKLLNVKKTGKKSKLKEPKKLTHRRSISVPDLRMIPGGASTPNSDSEPTDYNISPQISDSDSVASGSISEFTDKHNESFPEITFRVPREYRVSALSRMSAPAELMDEVSSVSRVIVSQEAPSSPVFRRIPSDPVPLPRSCFVNPQGLPPRPDGQERISVSSEDFPLESRARAESLAAALARAHSLGEQGSPYPRRSPRQPKRPLPDSRTPPMLREVLRPNFLPLNLDRMDGASPDSPNEERMDLASVTESEMQVRELLSQYYMAELGADDVLMEEAGQEVELMDDLVEMSSEPCEYFEENPPDVAENSGMGAGSEAQTPPPFQRYLVNINLKQGKNLAIKKKRSGSSDPYVKFKLEGKQFYKSKVVYKSLNPRWNETFSHPLRDRDHPVELRVYDKNRTSDEFMGSAHITLNNLELYKTYDMDLRLDDPKSKEDDLGFIVVEVCLMFRDATIKRTPKWAPKKNKSPALRPAELQRNQLRKQMWSGVFRITLVEGQDLPPCGHGDVYVRFRLGDQKYKSKNLCIQPNPQWREQFDFNQFEENQELLQVQVISKRGRKGEESWGLFEVDLCRLSLNETNLYTHVLDPGKGRLVFLVTLTPCWGVSISDMELAPLDKPEEKEAILDKFRLKNSHQCFGEVGFLQIKVIKANDLNPTDINGKSNPFCVVELGNCKLQTHTVYKSINPEWSKAFTFPVKDVHDVVELTVLDENGDKNPNFLGKVAVPLLSVQNGQEVCLFLKKEKLGSASKGSVTLVLEVIYNPVRAGVRTFQPKEAKLMEETPKFNKKVLAQNIYRVRKLSTAVLFTLQYLKSCSQWESTQRSFISFIIFLLTVWYGELFMLPLFLLLLIAWNYFLLSTGKTSSSSDLVHMSLGDEDDEDEKEAAKKGFMDKIHMVQEVVLVVQNVLGEVANIGERIKNIFNWSVPFLSCLSVLVLLGSTVLLYCFPLRYLLLIWGVNKFTKKLRNPYAIDNNEMLEFLKRLPSDLEKEQYSPLRTPPQPRKKK